MHCNESEALVPSYLDGELSEAQAGPLRKHLLACPACRSVAQEERALAGWFERPAPMTVPAGFAARVARRAFAGDTGSAPGWRAPGSEAGAAATSEGRLFSLVLHWTAAAAVVLVLLSIALRADEGTPRGEVQADNASLEWALEGLDQLNAPVAPSEPAGAEAEDGDETTDPVPSAPRPNGE